MQGTCAQLHWHWCFEQTPSFSNSLKRSSVVFSGVCRGETGDVLRLLWPVGVCVSVFKLPGSSRFIQAANASQYRSFLLMFQHEAKRFQQVLTETNVSHFILHHDHHGGIALQWSAHPMAMCWSWMPSVVADSAHVVKSASSTSSQEVMYVQVARTFSWHLNILIHFTGHERRSDIGCLFEIVEYRGATKTFNNFTNWSTEFDRVPQQAQQPDTLSQFSQSNCSQDSGLVPCLDRMFYLVLDVVSLSQSESVPGRASFGLRLITSNSERYMT